MKRVKITVSYDIDIKYTKTKEFKDFVKSFKNGEYKDCMQSNMYNVEAKIEIEKL